MDEIIINGVTIYVRDGIKYRKRKSGKLKKVCVMENCNKLITYKNTRLYCISHVNLLSNNDENEKKKMWEEENIKIQESKIIIDGIEIYFIDGKKYAKRKNGLFKRICMFENCNRFNNYERSYEYCCIHINGTDPNSPERIQQNW